ncbi:MAG: oxidoreductase, partial [Polyangiaceae bacterium]
MAELTPDDIARVIRTLEAIVEDRSHLSRLAHDERMALLLAAGRVSRPTRDEQQRASKAYRIVRRKHEREADRALRAATEIRSARRAEVYEAPRQLVSGMEGDVGALNTPRACYVCKTEFRHV